MRYFAYGSNMDPHQMARRCPDARALGPAVLPDHRLVFTFDSERWRGGVGHVVAERGQEVWGVLWDLTPADEQALDGYERVPKVYRKATVSVLAAGAPVEALIYLCNDDRPKLPSKRYLRALIRGASAHGLPEPYVRALTTVQTRGV